MEKRSAFCEAAIVALDPGRGINCLRMDGTSRLNKSGNSREDWQVTVFLVEKSTTPQIV